MRPGHHLVQAVEPCRDLLEEIRVLGDDAFPGTPPVLTADLAVAQVDLEVIEVEQPQTAHEALDADRRAGFIHHQVQEVMGAVEFTLGVDRLPGPELIRDARERPLEVRCQLPGVRSRRAARDPVAIDEQHALVRVSEDKEGRGDPRDSRAHHQHVRCVICVQRLRRNLAGHLGRPWRTRPLV